MFAIRRNTVEFPARSSAPDRPPLKPAGPDVSLPRTLFRSVSQMNTIGVSGRSAGCVGVLRMTDYKVRLDVYNGPLDLLLYLIRRNEIDIYDIPIAVVTEQYCRYCEALHVIDPNLAGDFLVMAATLMELKSRMLLPRPPAEDESADGEAVVDPRSDLIRQLLEYKRFKDASFRIGEAAALQAQRWPRGVEPQHATPPGEIDLEDVQIWDLVAAFNQVLSATGRGPITHDVIVDDTPLAQHAADILEQLSAAGGTLRFHEVFAGQPRARLIGLFLALLELIRQARVQAAQTETFGPIELVLLSAEPVTIVDEYVTLLPDMQAATMSPREDLASEADEVAMGDDDTAGDDDEFPELDAIRTDFDEPPTAGPVGG